MLYFGTDGVRGVATQLLENNIPHALGLALSEIGGKIIIARDVRTHSLDIEKQLCKGLLASGDCRIWLTGVLPTPALAYIAQEENADIALMITASHNPPEFNGIKVFGKRGEKLPLCTEQALDARLNEILHGAPPAPKYDGIAADLLTDDKISSPLAISLSAQNNRIRIASGARERYLNHLISLFPRFDKLKVRLDCAHGCMANLAGEVFSALGVSVICQNDTPDGTLVNVNCGSTHIDTFAQTVQRDEIGFAFDGDGDRVLAVVDGAPYDGDAILLAISTLYRLQGKLRKKFIVGTTLTNTRLQRELAFRGTALMRTDVGDKYILDALKKSNCPLGGEKSGHIIMLDKSPTGDGLLTALTLLEVKKTIGSLPKYLPYPMLEFNIRAESPKDYQSSDDFKRKVEIAEQKYGKKGRFIIRPSGTEPLIRIAYECYSQSCEPIFQEIRNIFAE